MNDLSLELELEGNTATTVLQVPPNLDAIAAAGARFGVSEARWSLYPMGGSAVRLLLDLVHVDRDRERSDARGVPGVVHLDQVVGHHRLRLAADQERQPSGLSGRDNAG